ncbi:peroxisomal sarcosine oxidase-like isoform X1 [Clytia hemisphaerica]|uniref:FAD dependent oxidoreductase domain-containing protein n=1 Tax=Clytia hemisphaerica TaxID=252671 RepID=A0A7M5UJR1_9CNID
MSTFDVIVIGAGINGSATAYDLRNKQHKNVLLLEQFPLPHTRGSSHGQTRVIRCLYHKRIYSQMTMDSFPIWRDLERQTNETLFIQNGMLEVYDNTTDSEKLNLSKKVLNDLNVPYKVLNTEEINRKYKPFHFEGDYSAIFESLGGTLMANKCLQAFQTLYKEAGGVLHDNEQVKQIIPGNDLVTVVTNKSQFKAKSLVITAGSFVAKLLKPLHLDLPLTIQRNHLCFWRVHNDGEGTLEAGFPSFKTPYLTYGTASIEYPGLLKICSHGGPTVDIDYPDQPPNMDDVTKLVTNHMKNVDHKPAIVENCLYTVSPDRDFILDRHPMYPNIVIGTGFSGTGFKMSPITGQILASLALNKNTKYDLSRFKISRFENVLKMKASL